MLHKAVVITKPDVKRKLIDDFSTSDHSSQENTHNFFFDLVFNAR